MNIAQFEQKVEHHFPNIKFSFSKHDDGYFLAKHDVEKMYIRYYPVLVNPWWEIIWVGVGFGSGETLYEAKDRMKVISTT